MAESHARVDPGSSFPEHDGAHRAFDVRHAFFILFRRRWLAAFIVLAVLVGVACGSYIRYPVYEATAKILIERATGSDIPFAQEQIAFKKAEITQTQAKLLTSAPVLEEVVRRLQLDQRRVPTESLRDAIHAFARRIGDRLRGWWIGFKRLIITGIFDRPYVLSGPPDPFHSAVDTLRKHVRVKPLPSTDIVALTVSDRHSGVAAAIANTNSEVYLENDLEALRERARRIYNTLDAQVEAFKPRYESAEAAVDRFEDEYSARLLTQQIRAKIQETSALELAYWELFETKQSKLVSLQLEIARLEQLYGPTHPRVLAARSELAEAIKRLRAGVDDDAANLALCSARVGWRNTLLVDADARRPGQARLFDIEADVGLSDVLAGDAERPVALHAIGDDALSLMTSGSAKRPSALTIEVDRLRTSLDEWRSRFDWVIVDAPPVLTSSGGIVWGRCGARLLFVVRAGRTRTEVIRYAARRVRDAGLCPLGAVLNRRRHVIPGYAYR